MQYEVHPTDQTWDIDQELNGSFKNSTCRTKKIAKMPSRFFPDMRFSRWFHRKAKFSFSTFKSDHSILRFPSKSAQSWKTLKNGCFWHCIVIIEWSGFFPGNPAVSVFLTYHPLDSYQVSWKSCARFSRFRADTLTNHDLSPRLNWSWELQRARRTNLNFSTSKFRTFDFLSLKL